MVNSRYNIVHSECDVRIILRPWHRLSSGLGCMAFGLGVLIIGLGGYFTTLQVEPLSMFLPVGLLAIAISLQSALRRDEWLASTDRFEIQRFFPGLRLRSRIYSGCTLLLIRSPLRAGETDKITGYSWTLCLRCGNRRVYLDTSSDDKGEMMALALELEKATGWKIEPPHLRLPGLAATEDKELLRPATSARLLHPASGASSGSNDNLVTPVELRTGEDQPNSLHL